MIDDPIVIRKARGALIVSSTNPTDPIQLIRQVSTAELEVHLKNGSKYIENVKDADMFEVILEMMGYTVYEVTVTTKMWPEGQEGGLKFHTGAKLQARGLDAFNTLFSETPYLNSKFMHVTFAKKETERPYYDGKYISYEVEFKFTFRGRVDMKEEIWLAFDDNVPHIARHISDAQTRGYKGSACAEAGHASIRMVE